MHWINVLNKTELAAPLGLSVPTIGEWLSILETTGQIAVVPPYFENFGKRLIKSPKVYWTDSGLVCHLLGVTTLPQLEASPFIGPVFEGFIGGELLKRQLNAGRRRELYFFRDERGLEIDFILPLGAGRLQFIEAKWTATVTSFDAKNLLSMKTALGDRPAEMLIVHRGAKSVPPRRQ